MRPSIKALLFKIGVFLMLITGGFPLVVTAANYTNFLASYYNPNQLWTASIGPKPSPYTLNDIRAIPDHAIPGKEIRDFGRTLADDLIAITQAGNANITTSGILILLITLYGLRERRKWAFSILLFIGLWAGMNDLVAMLRGGIAHPISLWPMGLGTAGLLLTVPTIFFSPPASSGSSAARLP